MLNKLPKHSQPRAKSDLHQIWMAHTWARGNARLAFNLFVQTYQPKYPKAAECLNKDKEALLTFYDFPAEHWVHLLTTKPIEPTFATVRLRTAKTRLRLPDQHPVDGVQAHQECEQRWLLLRGSELITRVIAGVQFKNGVITETENHQRVAA